ncbi:MAG: hypothetical protein WBG10_13700, partial [Pseudolabrys sp.]
IWVGATVWEIRVECIRMTTPGSLGGWDVHTHIIPPAVIAAGEKHLFGMHAEAKTLHICAHGFPMHPLSKVDALMERIKSDGLDGAIVSVPPPLFRPDLGSNDRTSYTRLVNDSLLAACRSHEPSLRPFAYLPIEDPELAADVASRLDTNWAGSVAGTNLGLLSYASERYNAWPFPMGASSAEHDLPGLDVNLKRRIRKTNAEHVFGSRLFTRASSGTSTKDIL